MPEWKAAVVGAGTIGGQLAGAFAAAGIDVLLKDTRPKRLERALDAIGERHGDAARGRVTPVTDHTAFGDVALAVEAVPDRDELKHQVLGELDTYTPGHAILATTTSGLSVTELAEATLRPERVIGLHAANGAPLVEVVEGEETAGDTVRAATAMVRAIGRTPVSVAEVPGFVLHRILFAGLSEIWQATEDGGLSIAAVDALLDGRGLLPGGPYRYVDALGLDTAFAVAEHMAAAYGPDRYVVHEGMAVQIAAGKTGARSGEGFYKGDGRAATGGSTPPRDDLADLFELRLLAEAALVLQEGVATHREIDLALTLGAGVPGPFARADEEGLDVVLARLERAAEAHGPAFAPPRILRRLVAQGRLGAASGQGFSPHARPEPTAPVTLETRGDVGIAWLAPAGALDAAVVDALAAVHGEARAGGLRALVIASSGPGGFGAPADPRTLDPATVAAAHAALDALGGEGPVTIAAVGGAALGFGCELAMACDVRLAGRSASFGLPAIRAGLLPAFGGTQRLPRLVGENKALEMTLTGDPIPATEAYEFGLVNELVADHELFDAALTWARRLSGRDPAAVAAIRAVSADPDLQAGLAAERAALVSLLTGGTT